MSATDYGWPKLEPNEIKSPTNFGDIKWNVKTGSTVRVGQLIATSTLTTDSVSAVGNKIGGMVGTASVASASETSTSTGANANANANANDDVKTEPAKPKIIRARRIKRNVKPAAAPPAPKPAAAANSEPNNVNEETKAPQSSFLGQYLKKSTVDSDTNKKVAELKSQEQEKGKSDERKKAGPEAKASGASIIRNSSTSKPSKEIRAQINGFLHIYVTVQCRRDPNNNNKLVHVLGKIEPCPHRMVVDGLCADCGQRINASAISSNGDTGPSSNSSENSNYNGTKEPNALNSNVNSQNNNSIQSPNRNKRNALTVSGGVTISISNEYAQALSTDTSQTLRLAKKLNLVLDLDHTLLHATADRRAAAWLGKCKDLNTLLLPIMEGHPLSNANANGGVAMVQPHYVKLRPHLAEFFCGLMDLYEISIYTAGTRMYAEKIADVISRHMADHLRKSGKRDKCSVADATNGEDDRCLDEGELRALRENVARMKERVSWYKSRKERQDYVEKMNEEFRLQQVKTEEAKDEEKKKAVDAGTSSEGGDKSDDGECIHMLAGVEDDEDLEDKSPIMENRQKRKRVTFAPSVKEQKEAEEPQKKLKVDVNKNANKNTQAEVEDPSEALEVLERKLKSAEAKEVEARSIRMKLFGSRIISRTDVGDLGRDVKCLKRVFPCGGMMAAIVDDREDVWANADNKLTGRKGEPPDNLLLVRPYHWSPFQKFADVNNSAGVDITKKNHKEESLDESGENQLIWTCDILRRAHDRYYKSKSQDGKFKTVPSILKEMRKEIFGKMSPPGKFLLSGLVPLHKQNSSLNFLNSPRPSVIRYAEELGAVIVNDVTEGLTHVVAARDGTEKVLKARRIPGCAIVEVSWLMECFWSCTLRDIKQHVIGPMPIPLQKPASEPKRILLSDGSDESEEEDDDFFEQLERDMSS